MPEACRPDPPSPTGVNFVFSLLRGITNCTGNTSPGKQGWPFFQVHFHLLFRFYSKMAAIDHCLYVETVIRGYHAYLLNHELTLGEVCIVESDPNGLVHDKYCLKFVAPNGQTVGHVPKFMSKLCFLRHFHNKVIGVLVVFFRPV